MSKNERIDCLNTFKDDELRIRKSKLFHKIAADGKKYFLNLSALDLNKVKFSAFLEDVPDLCCTV
jgi:hypothetical protein